MARCSSIGVEDVQLHFCDDFEGFCPSAVPRHRVPKTRTPTIGRSSGAVDEPPPPYQAHGNTHHTTDALPPTASGSCQPQILGQVREMSSNRDGVRRQSPLEIQRHVLRGVPANLVLRRCARLLSSAAGSEATFQLSAPTDHLEAFISHNWSVGRSRKWLALSLHWHFLSALGLWGPHCRRAVRGQLVGMVASLRRRRPPCAAIRASIVLSVVLLSSTSSSCLAPTCCLAASCATTKSSWTRRAFTRLTRSSNASGLSL